MDNYSSKKKYYFNGNYIKPHFSNREMDILSMV